MDEWMDGWMDGWMGVCLFVCLFVCLCIHNQTSGLLLYSHMHCHLLQGLLYIQNTIRTLHLPFPSPSFPPSLLSCHSPLPPHFSSLSTCICTLLFPRTFLYEVHLHSFTRTEIANIAELSMTRMTAYLPNPCNWPREAPLHPNHCRTLGH